MADPIFEWIDVEVRELRSEKRSGERTLQLSLKSRSNDSIQVLKISQSARNRERYSDRDNTYFEIEESIRKQLDEIENIISDEMLYSNREELMQRQRLTLKFIQDSIGGEIETIYDFLKYCAYAFYRPMVFAAIQREYDRKTQQTRVTISDVQHAREVLERCQERFPVRSELEIVLNSKIDNAEFLAEKLASIGSANVRIDPGNAYSEKFLFSFERGWIYPRIYNVSFEIWLRKSKSKVVGKTSIALKVLPNEFILAAIAVIFGVIGSVFVGWAEALQGDLNAPPAHFYFEPESMIFSGVLSFVFFTAYDYFNLSEKLDVQYSWRSAAFIGFGCGMFSLQILGLMGKMFGV